jgi:hypothetical protein
MTGDTAGYDTRVENQLLEFASHEGSERDNFIVAPTQDF